MRIVAFGDIHMELAALERIPELDKADLVLVSGDWTNFGGTRDAAGVIDVVRRINKNVYGVIGNLDHPEVGGVLDGLSMHIHGRGLLRGEVGVFGVGGSNPTPFNTPTEYSEDELVRCARAGLEQVAEAPVKVFVSHAPPHGTQADRIASGIHVGSTGIRSFIEEAQPDFCITGHIHESRGEDRIGRTLILNPGMLREPGWVEISRGPNGAWTARLN